MNPLPTAPLPGVRGIAPAAIAVGAAGVLLLGTKQALTVPYTGLGLPPAQLILFLLGVLWVLTRLVGQRAPAGLGVLSGLVFVRLMLTLISYGLASGRALLPDDRTSADQTIGTELIAAFLVIVLAVVLRRRRDIEFVLKCIVVGSAFSAVVALLQFAVHVDISSALHLPGLVDKATTARTVPLVREGLSRPGGVAGQPLEFGGVMTVTAPIAGALFFAARRRGERGTVWALAAILVVAGGVVSLSRSVFIGLGVAVVVMMFRWPARRTGVALAAVTATVGIALLAGGKLVTAISTLLTKGSNDYSLASRADGRSYVLDHFAQHFWFGQGPGTYDLTYQPVLDNRYLGQLMESGTLGLIFFVAVLVCALVYALRAAGRGVPADRSELANGLAGSLAALLVVNSILDTGGFVQISTLQFLVIGLTAALWRLNVADARPVTAPRSAVAAR